MRLLLLLILAEGVFYGYARSARVEPRVEYFDSSEFYEPSKLFESSESSENPETTIATTTYKDIPAIDEYVPSEKPSESPSKENVNSSSEKTVSSKSNDESSKEENVTTLERKKRKQNFILELINKICKTISSLLCAKIAMVKKLLCCIYNLLVKKLFFIFNVIVRPLCWIKKAMLLPFTKLYKVFCWILSCIGKSLNCFLSIFNRKK